MVFYQDDLEDVYLQSIPIVVAYNKVNHYTATKVISQEQFQSWKFEQCCLLGQSFIKSASIVNKQFLHNHTLFNKIPPTQIGKKSWDCEVCKKHFTRSNDLRDHKINFHKMGNPFICLTCSRTYTNKRNQHIKNKHENTYKYTFSNSKIW